MNVIEGNLSGEGLTFTLVVSRFNDIITSRLESGAIDCLIRHGVKQENIKVIRVPGAFEIPLGAAWATEENPDAVICLGAVIRGGTPHFEYISAEVSKGVASVSLDKGLPVGFGVLTCDSLEQALERAGSKGGNKGWEAAISCLEMAALKRNLVVSI
ncbi:6,7-dimethyl-8-ribityllumazine synthase [Oceanispirochaeta crateris]|uniref:6,7-dimethyl-8-ribityllumazine synthase n=2 Tax=Oceanispirochaeta crateris TaxID=2518645 RepID=A0A5C1QQY9_9SPIO|nr:6,7-dimethyl-8-ribityllumazine synthase [Oceanispirochaeta crateris]